MKIELKTIKTKKTPKEKSEENKIQSYLDSFNKKLDKNNKHIVVMYFNKTLGTGLTKKGIADIVCCYKSLYIGLEVKRKDNFTVSEFQRINCMNCVSAGGIYEFVNDVSQVKEIIDTIDGKGNYKFIKNEKDYLEVMAKMEVEAKEYRKKLNEYNKNQRKK